MTALLPANSSPGLPLPLEQREAINIFCQHYHIRRLALFGSFLREDFRSDSDIDMLVEFEPDFTPGLAFIRMQDELSDIFGGRQVDLVTEKFLNMRIRSRVLSEAQTIYAKG